MTPSDNPPRPTPMAQSDEAFRAALRDIVERSGRSMRQLSIAMGRDQGYVAALLDPTRPSRSRPTPIDLLRASDTTGIAFISLLESLWGIDRARIVAEILGQAPGASFDGLTEAERAEVRAFAEFLVARRAKPRHTPGR